MHKSLRFNVFKRDNFACAYCGRTPPAVTLEVDHIIPKSKGGENDINNYITSCFDCNRGKSKHSLTSIPKALQDNISEITEKELQLTAYNKLLQVKERRINKSIKAFYTHLEELGGSESIPDFKHSMLKTFFKLLPETEVLEALDIAWDKCCSDFPGYNGIKFLRYFCGVCWHKIKDNGKVVEDAK